MLFCLPVIVVVTSSDDSVVVSSGCSVVEGTVDVVSEAWLVVSAVVSGTVVLLKAMVIVVLSEV